MSERMSEKRLAELRDFTCYNIGICNYECYTVDELLDALIAERAALAHQKKVSEWLAGQLVSANEGGDLSAWNGWATPYWRRRWDSGDHSACCTNRGWLEAAEEAVGE